MQAIFQYKPNKAGSENDAKDKQPTKPAMGDGRSKAKVSPTPKNGSNALVNERIINNLCEQVGQNIIIVRSP